MVDCGDCSDCSECCACVIAVIAVIAVNVVHVVIAVIAVNVVIAVIAVIAVIVVNAVNVVIVVIAVNVVNGVNMLRGLLRGCGAARLRGCDRCLLSTATLPRTSQELPKSLPTRHSKSVSIQCGGTTPEIVGRSLNTTYDCSAANLPEASQEPHHAPLQKCQSPVWGDQTLKNFKSIFDANRTKN